MALQRIRSLMLRGGARLKTVGLALLVVPLGFLGLFAAGEVADGDVSGLSHVAQGLPLVLVAAVAYRWPAQAGAVLIVVGLAIVIAYAVIAAPRFEVATIAIVETILAVPVVSGALLLLAGNSSNRSGGSRPS
jgi:hypothetical protein